MELNIKAAVSDDRKDNSKRILRAAKMLTEKYPLAVEYMAEKFFDRKPDRVLKYIFEHSNNVDCQEKLKLFFHNQAMTQVSDDHFVFEKLKKTLEDVFEKEEARRILIKNSPVKKSPGIPPGDIGSPKESKDTYCEIHPAMTKNVRKAERVSYVQVNRTLECVGDIDQITRSFNFFKF